MRKATFRANSDAQGDRCCRDTPVNPASPVWRSCIRLIGLSLATVLWFFVTGVRAEEVIFLQDGRTIRAERTEIVGDRVRIEKPAETIELPRSDVLSIHKITPPTASPSAPPPAEVYRDLTQQMTDKVRREIQERPGASRTR